MAKAINYKTLFEDLLHIIEKSLQIAGLSDIYRRHSKRPKAFILFQRILFGFGTFQMPILMLGEMLMIYSIASAGKITTENFLVIAEVSPCLIMCAYSLMKSSRLVIKRRKIIEIVEEFKEMWPGDGEMDAETKGIVDKFMVPNRTIAITYSLSTHILSAVYNLFPVGIMIYNVWQNGQTDFLLPYLVWYPYDNSKNFWIWLSSFISQFYAGIYATGTVAGADCFFGLMASHLSMQIELLGKQIREISDEDTKATPRQKLDLAKPNLNHEPLKNLGLIFRGVVSGDIIFCGNSLAAVDTDPFRTFYSVYFKAIPRMIHFFSILICNSLEEVFSPVMLFNLVSSSVLICILIFSVTIAPLGLIAKYGFFISFSMTHILMMSWYGNKIITSSNKIGFAAYSCLWTNLDGPDSLHVKKSLVLMMARAQHPMRITAYGFTDISVKTFSNVLRASWSYFTLLRAMYQKSS